MYDPLTPPHLRFNYVFDQLTDEQYEIYIEKNKSTNTRKSNSIWIKSKAVELIVKFVTDNKIVIVNGICHGVRTGKEVQIFRQKFNANIIGTDLQFKNPIPHCIEWDFHKIKDEWLNSFDFIYSNSLDHTYDPDLSLDQWTKCLRQGGLLVIEWANDHNLGKNAPEGVKGNLGEPFRDTLEIYKNFVNKFTIVMDVQAYGDNHYIIFGIKQ